MGSKMLIVLACAAVILFADSEAAVGSCPQPSKVYSCSPKCVQNYDCSNGKLCCANSCNAKSCVEAAFGSAASDGKDKYSSGGAGTYCNNVKCNAYEVCKMDPATKRMKCQRS